MTARRSTKGINIAVLSKSRVISINSAKMGLNPEQIVSFPGNCCNPNFALPHSKKGKLRGWRLGARKPRADWNCNIREFTQRLVFRSFLAVCQIHVAAQWAILTIVFLPRVYESAITERMTSFFSHLGEFLHLVHLCNQPTGISSHPFPNFGNVYILVVPSGGFSRLSHWICLPLGGHSL